MIDTIEKEPKQPVLALHMEEEEPRKDCSRECFAEWMERNFYFYPKM